MTRPGSGFERPREPRPWLPVAVDLLFPPTGARLLFYAGLGRLLTAGVPLTQALQTLEQSGTGRLKRFARVCREGMERGGGLTASMQAAQLPFPAPAIALLSAGERTGRMPEVLADLANMEEQAIGAFRKLLSGLLYPFVVLVLSCFILPIPELVLGSEAVYAGKVLRSLLWLFGGVAAAWCALRLGLAGLDRALASAPPWLERLFFPIRASLFFRVLAAGTKAGLPLTDSLDLSRRVFTSRRNQDLVDKASTGLERGLDLTPSLAPFVRPADVVILATGEQSGTLEDAFHDVSKSMANRAAARNRVLVVIATVLLAAAMLAKVATSILSGYRSTVEAPMQELEREMQREMRGIWNDM